MSAAGQKASYVREDSERPMSDDSGNSVLCPESRERCPMSAGEREHLIRVCQPVDAKGLEYDHAIFELARRCKDRAEPGQGPEVFIGVVCRWREYAIERLPALAAKTVDQAMAQFTAGWTKARHQAGNELSSAIAEARSVPLPSVAYRYDDPCLRDLVGLCAVLHERAKVRPSQKQPKDVKGVCFWLTCRDAGRAIGVRHQVANLMLHSLCYDGILCRVVRGHVGLSSFYKYLHAPQTESPGHATEQPHDGPIHDPSDIPF